MARSRPLTALGRERMKASNFALPGRRYPMDTIGRARNAIARVHQHGTRAEIVRVERAVHRKWPSIEIAGLQRKR